MGQVQLPDLGSKVQKVIIVTLFEAEVIADINCQLNQ